MGCLCMEAISVISDVFVHERKEGYDDAVQRIADCLRATNRTDVMKHNKNSYNSARSISSAICSFVRTDGAGFLSPFSRIFCLRKSSVSF